MARDAEQLRDELDYWRTVLADLLKVNERLPAIADALVSGNVELALTGALLAVSAGSVPTTSAQLAAALTELRIAGETIGTIVDVIGGRVTQLQAEFDQLGGAE